MSKLYDLFCVQCYTKFKDSSFRSLCDNCKTREHQENMKKFAKKLMKDGDVETMDELLAKMFEGKGSVN